MRTLVSSAVVLFLLAGTPARAEIAAAPMVPEAAAPIVWEERSIGSADAPVTIYEYASLTCGHCAAFHEFVLPHVKAELIDTGKARLVYRDFPLNAGAMQAAALARCMPEQRYFPFISSVYQTQKTWAMGDNPEAALVRMASLAGVDEARARACMGSEALERRTVELMREAQNEYKINSTPSFVFFDKDGNRLKEYKSFTDLMEKYLKDAHVH